MKIFIDDLEIEEMKIEDSIKSNDKGIVVQKGEKGKTEHSELQKELSAIDALETTQHKSAEIHGTSRTNVEYWSQGKNVDPETKTNILSHKYDIADKATTKLMETLDLFDPSDIEKPTDLIDAASKLSSIVERVSGKDKNNSGQQVHLHLYNPSQKKISSYDVIDV